MNKETKKWLRLTVKETMELFKVTKQTLLVWRKKGYIEYEKLPNGYIIYIVEDLEYKGFCKRCLKYNQKGEN